MREIEVESAVM